jgi:hypothetical protein
MLAEKKEDEPQEKGRHSYENMSIGLLELCNKY